MDDTRKRPGWGGQGLFRRSRGLTTTTMTWGSAEFLVSIKVSLDGRVFNAILVFVDPSSALPFSNSGDVAVGICVP